MYVTPAQLADGPGAGLELAQLFDLDEALLLATIADGDRAAWTDDEIAAADTALASIVGVIAQADGEVNARLAQRGYPLPQSAEQFPVLLVWSRAIARYHLQRQRDRTTEETGRIERDYRDAVRALEQIAVGKLALGANDPIAAQDASGNAVRIESQPRLFSRDGLRDL